jgi:hypothetical protein
MRRCDSWCSSIGAQCSDGRRRFRGDGRDHAFGHHGLVAPANAEGLFKDNALSYRTIVSRTWPTYWPDTMIISSSSVTRRLRLSRCAGQ